MPSVTPTERNPEHRRVARDFSWYSTVNVASLFLVLGTALLLRRYLGPYLAGIWTALELLTVYGSYAHGGIFNAAERELPFLIGAGNRERFDRIRSTTYRFAHALGIVLGVSLLVAAVVLQGRLSRDVTVGLAVYGGIVYVQIVSAYYIVLYRATKRFVALSMRQGAINLLKAIATLAGGYSFGLHGVYGGLLIAAAVQIVLFHDAMRGSVADTAAEPERKGDIRLLAPLLRDGVVILLAGLAVETLRNADKLIIGARLGASSLGVYSIAPLLAQAFFYLPNAFAIVMNPRFQERYGATQDPAMLRKFVELPMGMMSDCLAIGIAAVVLALGPAIHRFLPQFTEAILPAQILLLGTYFVSLTAFGGQFLVTVRRQGIALALGTVSMAAALAGGWFAVPFGLAGIALASSVAFILHFALINVWTARLLRAPDSKPALARATAPGMAGLIGVALLLWWRPASIAAGDWTITCLVLALLGPAAWRLSRAVARVDNSTSIR